MWHKNPWSRLPIWDNARCAPRQQFDPHAHRPDRSSRERAARFRNACPECCVAPDRSRYAGRPPSADAPKHRIEHREGNRDERHTRIDRTRQPDRARPGRHAGARRAGRGHRAGGRAARESADAGRRRARGQQGRHDPRMERRRDERTGRLEGRAEAHRPVRRRQGPLLDRRLERRQVQGPAVRRPDGARASAQGLPDGRLSDAPQLRLPGFRPRAHPDQRTRGAARRQRLGPREGHRRGGAVPDPEDRRRGRLEPQAPLHGRRTHRAVRDDLLEQGRRLHAARPAAVDVGAVPLAEEQGRRGRRRRRDEAPERRALAGGPRGRADPRALVDERIVRRVALLPGPAAHTPRADVRLRQSGAGLREPGDASTSTRCTRARWTATTGSSSASRSC